MSDIQIGVDTDADDSRMSDTDTDHDALPDTPHMPTLLPGRVASTISFVTATTALGLRIGGFFGSAAINAARSVTLTGIEAYRVVAEGVLVRAAQDVNQRNGGDAAGGLVNSAVASLHQSITSTAFLVSTGFQIGSTGLTSGLAAAQIVLSALDAILGDTQTSRAVATIVVLVQREFDSPGAGLFAQRVGLFDILVGIIAFVLLQRWGEKRTMLENQAAGIEEVVWDMVVAPGSTSPPRAVEESDSDDEPDRRRLARSVSFISANGTEAPFEAVGDGRSFISAASVNTLHARQGRKTDPGEEAFRHSISSQFAPGTRISLNAVSYSQDIVTIEVKDRSNSEQIEAPPGFELLSQEAAPWSEATTRYTFQRKRKRRRRGSFDVRPLQPIQVAIPQPELDAEDLSFGPSTPTPLSPSPESEREFDFETEPGIQRSKSEPNLQPRDLPILANQARARAPRPSSQDEDGDDKMDLDQPELFDDEDLIGPTPTRKSMRRGKSVKRLVEFWSSNKHKPKRQALGQAFDPRLDPRVLDASIAMSARVPDARQSFDGARDDRSAAESLFSRGHHQRASIYSIASMASETSLVLRSHVDDMSIAQQLYRNGTIHGIYPPAPLSTNLARFSKFAIAAYGSMFLRLTNSWQQDEAMPQTTEDLPEHHTFTSYTKLPASSVLLSSYVDPVGGITSNVNEPGLPLVHYVAVDHDTRAIVLTCRGTLGFEDVLTDLTGDYDNLRWQGAVHQVHRGVLASARRLISLHGGRLVATLKAALEEFEDYGLVLCGHSLGGAVAAVLAVLLAQPNSTSAGGASKYTTAPRLVGSMLALPVNRPIHAYAYGPAACFSPSLQRATRGLVTTVVYGRDVVPFLTLGTLQDVQAMAHAFATDSHNAKDQVVRRVKAGLYAAFRDRSGLGALTGMVHTVWNSASAWNDPSETMEDDDHWPWIALKSLRASMLADKLVPPGEIFVVEAAPVLQRHAFVERDGSAAPATAGSHAGLPPSYRPATHVKVTHVCDPEAHFREIRFKPSMFADHFPGRYELALASLERGLGSIL